MKNHTQEAMEGHNIKPKDDRARRSQHPARPTPTQGFGSASGGQKAPNARADLVQLRTGVSRLSLVVAMRCLSPSAASLDMLTVGEASKVVSKVVRARGRPGMTCHGSATRRSLFVERTPGLVRKLPHHARFLSCEVVARVWRRQSSPNTMAARGAAEEVEDAAKLELGAEFEEARVLMIAEVNVVLATYQSKNEVQGVEDKPNAIFEKCDEVSRSHKMAIPHFNPLLHEAAGLVEAGMAS
jgi:hypothetical protein